MTILIIEDNAGVRRLLCRAVASVAHCIWECDDGDKALTAYSDHRPDVVLMDVRMRHIDGLTAMRQIRQYDPAARIIVVTAYNDGALRSEAEEAGSCGYVLKENLLMLPDIISSVFATDGSRP